MVKGKYINEKARAAYKEAEKKIKPKSEGPLSKYKEDDMVKMMDKIDALESSIRILANRLNRVDGMGNIKNDL